MPKVANIFRLLVLLTILFVTAQVTFLVLGEMFADLVTITRFTLTPRLIFSPAVYPAVLAFLAAQFVCYLTYLFVLWYVARAICDGLRLQGALAYLITFFLWANSIATLLLLNAYFIPHSVFTKLFLHDFLNDKLQIGDVKFALVITLFINACALLFAMIVMIRDIMRFKHLLRHGAFLSLLTIVIVFVAVLPAMHYNKTFNVATEKTPNIFIIGFDAVRPDFIRFFNPDALPTPQFDKFLESSVIFTRTYTPLARTLPSWANILTAQYPKNNNIRENNTLLDLVKINETLPKRLQEFGYTTFYASDDRRYNNIDKRFGFDTIIGPSGSIPDFMFGTLNDFPLSNLIAPTEIGKFLFPYNYANHGADFVYNPKNFLHELDNALQTAPNKPLFMAVHFNLSAWPFYWFNDHMTYNTSALERYKSAIVADDALFSDFITILRDNHYLDHAIVILVSDHGITHGLRGDRLTSEAFYEGQPNQMKIRRFRYADAKDYQLNEGEIALLKSGSAWQPNFEQGSPFDLKDLGFDTSYGYGGDLLSLKQNFSVLAMNAYGLQIGPPHRVENRVVLMDIAPTIIDILQLPALENIDGISLKPYLENKTSQEPERPIYFESGYSMAEIEQQDIVTSRVLKESLKFFYVNSNTGAVTLYPPFLKMLLGNKQRAILEGDWLLVYYPQSERFTFVPYSDKAANKMINPIVISSRDKDGATKSWGIQKHLLAPYFVLVNVKTGKWTTSVKNTFAKSAPLEELQHKIAQFYGDEMANYGES